MPRILLFVLLSLFLAGAAHAQSESADLKIEFEFPQEEHLTFEGFSTWVRIRNTGPSTARGLVITADAPGVRSLSFYQTLTYCENATTCTTNFGDLAPDAYVEFNVSFQLSSAKETTIPLTVRVASSTPDPNAANNVVSQDEVFVALPELYTQLNLSYDRLEPELPTNLTFGVNNIGRTASLGTVVELTLPAGASVISVAPPSGVTCTNTTTTVRCEAGTIQPNSGVTIGVTARTPAAYDGGSFPVTARATASNRTRQSNLSENTSSWYFVPLFLVQNAADSGPGSLRQAIVDGIARCKVEQCRIAFRMPESQFVNGAATIRLATPLPPITAALTIDGNSEKIFLGNPNADHPFVQLDGSLLAAGDGLQLRADASSVSGLAIGNFPGIGVLMVPVEKQVYLRSISDCFIGTDTTGRVAMPNERGVMILDVRYGLIRGNLISGNRRSGLWLLGSVQFGVDHNRIGVASDGETPLPNGASGIYVGPGTYRPIIHANTIAYNAQFGIAIHPLVRYIDASTNSIFGNGNLGIDIGLDMRTPNVAVDLGRQPNTPVLLSATYDASTNMTRIEGEVHSFAEAPPLGNRVHVFLYENDSANAQAQRLIVESNADGTGHFTVNVNRDLRGKFITGITLRYRKGDEGTLEEYAISEETSEISVPLEVK